MQYKIRKSTKDDIQAIANIYINAWKYAYQGIVPDNYLDNLSVEGFLKRRQGVVKEHVFELDDKVIGVAYFCKRRDDDLSEDVAEIVTIYFLPEYTSKGYGGQFLKWILDELRAQSYCDCIIWVLEENLRARRAYEKVGFEYTGKQKTLNIGGKDVQELCYQMTL